MIRLSKCILRFRGRLESWSRSRRGSRRMQNEKLRGLQNRMSTRRVLSRQVLREVTKSEDLMRKKLKCSMI